MCVCRCVSGLGLGGPGTCPAADLKRLGAFKKKKKTVQLPRRQSTRVYRVIALRISRHDTTISYSDGN